MKSGGTGRKRQPSADGNVSGGLGWPEESPTQVNPGAPSALGWPTQGHGMTPDDEMTPEDEMAPSEDGSGT